jgi:hypothetical protein
MQRYSSILILAVLTFSLSGCILYDGTGSKEAPTDLNAAIARWESLGWQDYNMRIIRGCFCLWAGEHEVIVRDGAVVDVRPVEEWQEPVGRGWEYFPSIDDLFDEIGRAAREADDLQVVYNEKGYPDTISIDWIAEAVDDEMAYSVLAVVPVEGSSAHSLAIGETVSLDDRVFVTLDDIVEDSRCASNANCIWAGRAVAQLTFSTSRARLLTVLLVSGEMLDGETDQADYGGYHVKVARVSPYPDLAGVPIPRDDYRVILLADKPD